MSQTQIAISDTDSGESEDPVDVGEYQPEDGWDVVRSYNPLYIVPTELINKHIAYKYTTVSQRAGAEGA